MAGPSTRQNVVRAITSLPSDKERPKKPLASYFLFLEQVRKDITAKHPTMNAIEKAKLAGEMYRQLNEMEKQKYIEEAKKLSAQYQIQKQEWKSSLSKEDLHAIEKDKQKKKTKRIKKMIKENNRPKRPKNAYAIYFTEAWGIEKDKNKNVEYKPEVIRQFATKCGQDWHVLPESQKKVYQDKAKADADRYHRELAAWEKEMMNGGKQKLVRLSSVAAAKEADKQARKEAKAKLSPKSTTKTKNRKRASRK